MKTGAIEKYRQRIAIATLRRMKRKTGGYRLSIPMPDESIQFIDIDEETMQKLLQRFERQARNEFGTEADDFLRTTYMNCIDINGNTEYLTETGKMIIDDIFSELIKHVKKEYKKRIKNAN